MLKLLLSGLMNSGIGERFSEDRTSDFKGLTDTLAALKAKKAEASPAPMDRLKDAFAQLKDMHKDDAPAPEPFSFETAQWPYGPVGAPSQAQASASPPPAPQPQQAAAPVPMPAPRPAEAPQQMGFFQRNAAMMRDPSTGDFIDPSAAAQAGNGGILNGLFG